jgi:hypothetical protein
VQRTVAKIALSRDRFSQLREKSTSSALPPQTTSSLAERKSSIPKKPHYGLEKPH